MMTQEKTIIIFKAFWIILLFVAALAQLAFKGKLKKKSGIVINLIVTSPYLIVFGWFSVRDYLGTYKGSLIMQISGIILMVSGTLGYIVSILFLRHNWAISAAIKEGHKIVKNGPYKYIRHPMYFCMILTTLGSGLLISNYPIILYTPIVFFIYYLRGKKEEEMLKEEFPEYEKYGKETRMIIPGFL